MKCIGATTFTEYRGIFEKDAALVAALPEGRRGRAVGGADDRDPQGPEVALRGAPQRQVRGRCPAGCGRVVGQVHQRPPPAGQGDRRHRRGRCSAAHPAGQQAQEDDHARRGRGNRGQDRAHPACHRVQRRPQQAQDAGPRPQERGLRPGPGDRRTGRRDQDGAVRARQGATSRSARSCSAAPPVSARPRSPSSWPTSWAST